MIDMITPEKLKDPHINDDADHLADAMYYWRTIVGTRLRNYMHAEQHSYACECKRCDITHYTSYKRLNCEFCGCDSDQFTCRELK